MRILRHLHDTLLQNEGSTWKPYILIQGFDLFAAISISSENSSKKKNKVDKLHWYEKKFGSKVHARFYKHRNVTLKGILFTR